MNNLGAFFQTYKNKKAVEFVIENYRKYYPESPITLISDGGSDFSEIAEKYKCNYIHSFVNLGQPGSQNIKINSDYSINPRLAFNKEETFIWLNRLYQACKYSVANNSDHILFLEDDVYIKKIISYLPSNDGFSCGENKDNLINPILIEYLEKKYNIIFNVRYYACCGGAIFNAKAFVEKYYFIINFLDKEYDIIQSLDNRFGWLDLYMHVIHYLIGCKYEVNPEFAETWMNVPWESEKYSIVHQYKNFY